MGTINIQQFRADGSKIYSGRDMGILARKKMDLSNKDKDDAEYEIIIPEDTYSINGSFFGGMFSDSVISLGKDKFIKKYVFKFAKGDLSETLNRDIEEGISDAINDL